MINLRGWCHFPFRPIRSREEQRPPRFSEGNTAPTLIVMVLVLLALVVVVVRHWW